MTKVREDSFTDFDYADFGRFADRLLTPVAVASPGSTLLYANDVAADLVNPSTSEVVGEKMLSFVDVDDRARVRSELEKFLGGEPSAGFTRHRLRGRHRRRWRTFDSHAHNLIDDPHVRWILASGGDVSERAHLSKALRILSEGNQHLAHATDEAILVAEVCQSTIDSGEYLVAWAGYVEHDEAKTVRNGASNGLTAFVDSVHVSWGDNCFGDGPTGTAVKTNTVKIVDDLPRSRRRAPWRAQVERYGVRTSCALPQTARDVSTGRRSRRLSTRPSSMVRQNGCTESLSHMGTFGSSVRVRR